MASDCDHILDMFSGHPRLHDLLDTPWSWDFSCTRFVATALNVPYVFGGSWGCILNRPRVFTFDTRPGDIVVWCITQDCFSPGHAAVLIGPDTILHNGYDSSDKPPRVTFASFTPTRDCIIYYRGRYLY